MTIREKHMVSPWQDDSLRCMWLISFFAIQRFKCENAKTSCSFQFYVNALAIYQVPCQAFQGTDSCR